ncbi:GNAT family N-acetyltransferase [Deminuibacter soli]|uniref:N-acetyltransferase n=1 Tax=Deminuibacter soli TaxID=2291815 RepID=A0A3E1NLJ5_9BACT|nr:GNAT family N-acetyltransferase [Deminuibacter soli]RFM28714.1 N-acetyltransferase [Deminuibacter soli]
MQTPITTGRLSIERLSVSDSAFMVELLNSKGWLAFIGERHVHSKEDAEAYINKINGTPNFTYLVVKLKENRLPIGIISLIQRDYLPHIDLGFALLPGFMGAGYAYEGAHAVMEHMLQNVEKLLAIALPQNTSSIQLLQKLGFAYEEAVTVNNEVLHVYAIHRK